MKLIVGLGNPGRQYNLTRHNIGFMVIDELIKSANLRIISSKKANAAVAKGKLAGKNILAAKPMTFMNNSGEVAQKLASFFKVNHKDIIVVHDDKDIAFGEVKVHTGRGAAGHNGVLSIIQSLGTKNFTRIRIGVASDQSKQIDTANFVLAKFNNNQKGQLDKIINETIKKLTTQV